MILKIFRRTTVQIVKEKMFTLEPFGAQNLKYLEKMFFGEISATLHVKIGLL